MLPVCSQKQVQLSRQYQQNTLAHAVLIQGAEGTGKQALADWLLALLICQTPVTINNTDGVISQACGHCKTCLLNKSGSYPDHLAFIDDNKTLGVDDIRRSNTFLETKPHIGSVKTLFIPNAENMTVASANALLKTLEEPNKNSFIVLITEALDSLLPTIVSRCSVYSIRPKVGQALLTELRIDSAYSNTEPTSIDGNFFNLSQLPELADNTVLEAFESFKNNFMAYLSEGQYEAELINSVVTNQHGLRWLEKVTSNLIRQYYLVDKNSKELITIHQKVPVEALNQIFQAIINSNKLIKSYAQANRQFVGEQLIMTINEIVRPIT